MNNMNTKKLELSMQKLSKDFQVLSACFARLGMELNKNNDNQRETT